MTDHIDDRDKYADVEPGAAQYVLRDSGQRQEFETGSRRDTRDGKGRFDLIPQYPQYRLALLMERGADKYGERNWEKGQPVMRYLDSASRHLSNLLAGEQTEDHAIQAVFNLFGFVHTLREIELGHLPAKLDDRPERMLPTISLKADPAPAPCGPSGQAGPEPCCGLHSPEMGAL